MVMSSLMCPGRQTGQARSCYGLEVKCGCMLCQACPLSHVLSMHGRKHVLHVDLTWFSLIPRLFSVLMAWPTGFIGSVLLIGFQCTLMIIHELSDCNNQSLILSKWRLLGHEAHSYSVGLVKYFPNINRISQKLN